MISNKQLFFNSLAQTSTTPLALEITRAEGMYLYGPDNKKYLDLLAGISVSNLGHQNAEIIASIKEQLDKHMHIMVYGELVLAPQVKLTTKLVEMLGDPFESVYLANSGAEANDGALKLAKIFTGRPNIVSFKKAYHGSLQGPLSVMGDEELKQPFRPLLPGIRFAEFNEPDSLSVIDETCAAVIVEPVQGEAGYRTPKNGFLTKLRKRCTEVGALLIFDEIQTGFGRTGSMFAFKKYDVLPDIICMAKGLGGGMPIGAFASSSEIMNSLNSNPILGHITTFGGHPVSAAASLTNISIINDRLESFEIHKKEQLFRELLVHPKIKGITGAGLMLAVELSNFDEVQKSMDYCIENGVLIDWFLFNNYSLRISPPLIIDENQIREACSVIIKSLDQVN